LCLSVPRRDDALTAGLVALLRPCIEPDCGILTRGTRCPAHQRERQAAVARERKPYHDARYGGGWKRAARATVKRHVESVGWYCPGWRRPPHPSGDLVVDHGPPLSVMCRACNGRKAATVDKQRAAARRSRAS
jgi:5-methylcytosine-specific restriction protein A